MSAFIYNIVEELVRLTTAVGAVPLLAPTFHLFENNFTPTPTSLLADYVEATFSGYAAVATAFGTPGLDPNNIPVAPAPVTYITTGVTPGVAYGIYILDSTGALVAGSRFDGAPFNFAVAGDQLVGTVLFGLDEGTFTVAIGP
jgi:hypothetical protein